MAFNTKKIKKAIFSYFANIMATPEDKEQFAEIFRTMDKDGDGILTSEEFEEAMQKIVETEEPKKIRELTKGIIKKG